MSPLGFHLVSISFLFALQLCMESPEYLQAARSRASSAAAPKPPANALQFVKVGPCHLYRSAQEQLRKAEEVKKQTAKDVRRDHHEDWQSVSNHFCSKLLPEGMLKVI